VRSRLGPVIAAAVAAVLTFSVTFVHASSLPLTAPPGVNQTSSNQVIQNDVRDRFTIRATAPLAGQATDFDGGAGWAADAGPTWSTFTGGVPSADWVNLSSNFVQRPTGSGYSAALVPWLVRQSRVQIEMRQLSTTSAGGVIMGADPTGADGLAAVGFHDGSRFRFAIFLLSAGSLTPCSPWLDMGTNPGNRWRIGLTFTPATGGIASATLARFGGGGGRFDLASTCSTASASGAHSGLLSTNADSTRYDSFVAGL
jgi:hypothetical protein